MLVFTMNPILFVFRAFGLLGSLLVAEIALAGSFSVKPIRISFKDIPQASMSIGNTSGEEIFVQAELMAWTQQDGKDVYTPSREIMMSPPMFKIPAGEEQTIRLRAMGDGAIAQERAYRLFLQEVPLSKSKESTVATVLRIGVPIFIQPAKIDPAEYVWQATYSAGGMAVELNNNTNSHVQITALKLTSPDGKVLSDEKVFVYVLPGQTYKWEINQSWVGNKVVIHADSDRGNIRSEVDLFGSRMKAP
jgi:fimbrial chaperone protein